MVGNMHKLIVRFRGGGTDYWYGHSYILQYLNRNVFSYIVPYSRRVCVHMSRSSFMGHITKVNRNSQMYSKRMLLHWYDVYWVCAHNYMGPACEIIDRPVRNKLCLSRPAQLSMHEVCK